MVCSPLINNIFSFTLTWNNLFFFFLHRLLFLNLSFQCGKLLFFISISLADVPKLLETSREFHNLAPPQSLLSSVLRSIKTSLKEEGRIFKCCSSLSNSSCLFFSIGSSPEDWCRVNYVKFWKPSLQRIVLEWAPKISFYLIKVDQKMHNLALSFFFFFRCQYKSLPLTLEKVGLQGTLPQKPGSSI